MKRFLSLTLALLMAAALLGAAGTRTYAHAAGEEAYVGLWEITGIEENGARTVYADAGVKAYLDFLNSGAICAVTVSGGAATGNYLGYQVTGANALALYWGDDPVPGAYDPASGVITVTKAKTGRKTFLQRVTENPLPDIRALVNLSGAARTYYGYSAKQGGQGGLAFAPEGEAEAVMTVLGTSKVNLPAVNVSPKAVVGKWKLAKAINAGKTLSAEEIKAQGLELSFVCNADGSAAMTENGVTTEDMTWTAEGSTVKLTKHFTRDIFFYSYDVFELSYDGTCLLLNMMAKRLYFEKVG